MARSLAYSGSGATVVAGPQGGCLTSSSEMAHRLWPLIEAGASFGEVLDAVLRDGLAGFADLVLFHWEGTDLTVLVRGRLRAQVTPDRGDLVELDGRGVRTWVEQTFADPAEACFEFLADGTSGPSEGSGPPQPLQVGMATAGRTEWRPAGAPSTVRPAPTTIHQLRSSATLPAPPARSPEPVWPIDSEPDREPDRPSAPEPVLARDEVSAFPPQSAPESAVDESAAAVSAVGEPPATLPETRSELPETRTEPLDGSMDHLFGSTILRSVEEAAIRPVDVAEEPAATGTDLEGFIASGPRMTEPSPPTTRRPGDHDGSTILAGGLAALRRVEHETEQDPAPAGVVTFVLVVEGQRLAVDRAVIIGRRPHVEKVTGTHLPHLVTVPSPNQDISRNHLQVTPSGSVLAVQDLGSTNGSTLRRPDRTSAAIANGNQVTAGPGDVLDLGDGVLIAVEHDR